MSHKVYTDTESTIYFLPGSAASGVDCVLCDAMGLPATSGYRSDVRDLGAPPRATLFRWRGKFATVGDPGQNTGMDIFWSSFDTPSETGSTAGRNFGFDGGLGSGEGVVADAISRIDNLQWIGSVVATPESSGTVFTSCGLTQLYGRYGQVLVYNATLATMSTDPNQFGVSLQGVPDELQ